MKKTSLLIVLFIVVIGQANLASAQVKLGFHGGYSAGGDLEKKDIGIGGQVIVSLSENVSVELSATEFQDKAEVLTVDVTHIAATLRLSTPIIDDKTKLYGGAGVSHNQFVAEVSLPGYFVDIDDVFGVHLAVGASTMLMERIELFGEYRYVWSESSAEIRGPCGCEPETVEGDYDFGLFRIGINYLF